VYGLGFRSLSYQNGFLMMGCIVIVSSFLSVFIDIPCHAAMLWGEDNHAVIQARERFLQNRQARLATGATVDSEPRAHASDADVEYVDPHAVVDLEKVINNLELSVEGNERIPEVNYVA
jgi:hypothetical protein